MNALLAIALKLFTAFSGFVVIFIASRILDDEPLGVFLYLFSFITVAVQISKSGADLYLVRSLSSEKSLAGRFRLVIYTIAYTLLVAVAINVLFISLVLSGYLQVLNGNAYTVAALTSCLAVIASTASQVLAAYFQSKHYVVSQYWSLNLGLACFLTVLLITSDLTAYKLDVSVVCFYVLMSAVLSLSFSIFMYYRDLDVFDVRSFGRFSISQVLQVGRFNTVFFIASVLTIFMQWLVVLVSGFIYPAIVVADISLSVRLAALIAFPFLAVAGYFAPKFSRVEIEGFEESILEYSPYHLVSLIFALTFCVLCFYCGDSLLAMFNVVSDGFNLFLISLSWLLRVAVGPVGTILMLRGSPKLNVISLLLSVLVVLIILLFGTAGNYTAGYAILAGSLVMSILNLYFVWRRFLVVFVSPRYVMRGVFVGIGLLRTSRM